MTKMMYGSRQKDGLQEWSIIELQGDLEVRGNQMMNGQFIGDLSYDKYGQPILIIGHHILHGKEQKLENPFAVLHKTRLSGKQSGSNDMPNSQQSMNDSQATQMSVSQHVDDASLLSRTVLDSTVAIEHKTRHNQEFQVLAIITRRLVFKSRPKPIIANVAKQV